MIKNNVTYALGANSHQTAKFVIEEDYMKGSENAPKESHLNTSQQVSRKKSIICENYFEPLKSERKIDRRK